ncbi:MAG TPA: hypothetical protein VNA12_08300 [Mycobacteriales bacterium]|nr:hypothetical protein [Mycobacteriales bacterium]
MRAFGRAASFAAAMSVTLATVACSGDEPGRRTARRETGFRTEYTQLREDFATRSAEIQRQAAQAKDGGLDATLEVFAAIKDSADDAAAEFRSLRTPPQVQPALTQLLQLLAEQSDLLARLIDAGRRKNHAVVAKATRDLTTLTQRISDAATAVERAMAACGRACD